MSKIAIGIDLGTTNSYVGIWKHNTVEIIPNDVGERITSSYVSFSDTERLIGTTAKYQAIRNSENTLYDSKRLIGRKFDDPIVQADMKLWPFTVVRGKDDCPVIEFGHKGEKKRLLPEEVSSMVLGHMKKISEEYLGQPVTNAIITVSSCFNHSQTQAIMDAARSAGLNVLMTLNEATAAAIAYGFERQKGGKTQERNVLVFDLGGGTLDVSLLCIEEGVFEVKAVAGDGHLGGQDFNNKLVQYFIDEIKKKHKVDITTSKRAIRKLATECERVKLTLSAAEKANIEIDLLHEGIDFASSITRAKFEDLIRDDVRKCMEPVARVLSDSGMSKQNIHDILLVGGSTRIPIVQKMLKEFFGKELCKSINPDEAAAYGAAIQAAILSGCEMNEASGLVLLDVAPLSLGIETAGGLMTKLIERNKTTPCKASEIFTTYCDNQSSVIIKIYEGERQFTKDNNLLGAFELMNIPLLPRGEPQIEVTFEIQNKTVSVKAKDKKNPSLFNEITIGRYNNRLSEKEMENTMKAVQLYEKEDEESDKKTEEKKYSEDFRHDPKYKDLFQTEDKLEIETESQRIEKEKDMISNEKENLHKTSIIIGEVEKIKKENIQIRKELEKIKEDNIKKDKEIISLKFQMENLYNEMKKLQTYR